VTISRKVDTDAIKQHVKNLREQPWLGQARAWWPNFLFRFDNIDATATILNCGKLLSRSAAVATGVMALDCASPEIISSTASKWKEYVRLYFRPRTPTQIVSEGFRPADRYVLGAHCPVPVVMLFDSVDILTRHDTEFSEGNLAANASTGNNSSFLQNIPFETVYHNSWMTEEEKRSVIFHRHAEVIIPGELDLSALRFIGCRTQAEYETLFHLLASEARERWSAKMGLGTRANLHFRRWTFVEQVDLSSKEIRFKFNPSSSTPGPFYACVVIREDSTGDEYAWENRSYMADSELRLALRSLKDPSGYVVKLTLDGRLVYSNHYQEYDIPF